MLRQKPKLPNQNDLPLRIQRLRDECNRVIDEKAKEMTPPGVPFAAVRLTLTAPYGGDPLDSALAILATEGN
jgi:hypothetical protein